MKTTILLLATVLLTMLLSCEKDENGTDTTKNSHRIKQIVKSENSKTVFTYDSEKLILKMRYEENDNGDWVEYEKNEISYNGNTITIMGFYKSEWTGGNWKLWMKDELVVENNLIIEENNDNKEENGYKSKTTYQYSNNMLIGLEGLSDKDGDGIFNLNGKEEYSYENNLIKEVKWFRNNESDNWVLEGKYNFTHSGNKISGYISYWDDDYDAIDELLPYRKSEYTYSGNLLIKRKWDRINTETGNWRNEWRDKHEYEYNSEGYLIKCIEDEEDTVRTYEYEYEEGHGNALLIEYDPEDIVFGEPTIK